MKFHAPIGIWTVGATCLGFCSAPQAAEAVKPATVSVGKGEIEQNHDVSPPAVLVFEHPTNGSIIQGTNTELQFTLRSSRSGPALTYEEVSTLREDGACICFAVQRVFQNEPTLCTEFTTEVLSVSGLLPGAWHTITATLHHTAVSGVGHAEVIRVLEDVESKWDLAGDNVTLLVAVDSTTTMCGESVCLDRSDVRATYFDTVYREGQWGETRSGPGSTILSTIGARLAVEYMIHFRGVTSMLDAPCGDLTWMPLVHGIDGVRYTGADISVSIVNENRRKFPPPQDSEGWGTGATTTGEKGRNLSRKAGGFKEAVFVQADLIEDVPPSVDGEPYDLIFVRDIMLHLAPRHNLRLLQNIEASGAKFFMASTYVNGNDNWKADTFIPAIGHFLNLSLPPYCLRPPAALFLDNALDRGDKRMGLWEIDPAKPLVNLNGSCQQVAWD